MLNKIRNLIFILPLVLNSNTYAQNLVVDITEGNIDPLPIAIQKFVSEANSDDIGENIVRVISNDLVSTGLFEVVNQQAYIEKPKPPSIRPVFNNWDPLGVKALVTGSATINSSGTVEVEFRLWDVVTEQDLTGLKLSVDSKYWRRISHIAADEIYKRLTGEEGYFDTRLVYISESGPLNARVKRLAIMDQDGHNHQYLTDGSYLVLTPRFSPTSQEVAYLAYFQNQPRVYVLNLETNRQELLGTFPGMTFAPRFSPDGKSIIMSLADQGLTDIFIMNLLTQEVNQLTNSPSIDTSPTFSPDGQNIVFNSDRGGSQQLYVMNLDGTKQKRISFKEGRYATPVWSPRGDLIAFTKMHQGHFYIGVMRPDGSGERLISKGYLVEAPTWAPNGRVLMYFKQEKSNADGTGGKVRLFRVDITGYNEREIITPSDASDPAWSPLIP
mgnify:CR=1 FL=1